MTRIISVILVTLALLVSAQAAEMNTLISFLRDNGVGSTLGGEIARGLGRGHKPIPVKARKFKGPAGHELLAAIDDTGEVFFVDYQSKKERTIYRATSDGKLLSMVRIHKGRLHEEGKSHEEEFEETRETVLGNRKF